MRRLYELTFLVMISIISLGVFDNGIVVLSIWYFFFFYYKQIVIRENAFLTFYSFAKKI